MDRRIPLLVVAVLVPFSWLKLRVASHVTGQRFSRAEVAALVAACLAKDPAQRPGAESVAGSLASFRVAHYPRWDPRTLFSGLA